MKARSVVFPQLQRPTTVFGLPVKMMGANFAATVLFNLGSVAFGAIVVSFIGAGAVFVIGLALIYRASRRDHHVETIFLSALRFWGVSTRRRWLLAGATAPRCSRGSRS